MTDYINIQTHAYKIQFDCNHKRLQKSTAQEVVESLYKEATDEHTKQRLAKLYTYFTPPIPKSPKKPLQWINLASGKQDSRPYLDNIYCANGELVATDGHRLHLMKYEDAGLTEEEYKKVENNWIDSNKNIIENVKNFTYPDYPRILPRGTHHEDLDLTQNFQMSKGEKDVKEIIHLNIFGVEVRYNYRYFREAVQSDKHCKIYCDNCPEGGLVPVLFVFKDRKAVVMPLRN